jgi:hypothetical protein
VIFGSNVFTGSVSSVQSTLGKLTGEREELGELWTTRKLRLDLCLQLRLFERDALELSAQFEVTDLCILCTPNKRWLIGLAQHTVASCLQSLVQIQHDATKIHMPPEKQLYGIKFLDGRRSLNNKVDYSKHL